MSIIEEYEKSDRGSVQSIVVSAESGRRKSKISNGVVIDQKPQKIILHRHTVKVLRPSVS